MSLEVDVKILKKIGITILSLGLGFLSYDYLYKAFSFLTASETVKGHYEVSDFAWQILGALMFVLWFFLLVLYWNLIRRLLFWFSVKRGNRDKEDLEASGISGDKLRESTDREKDKKRGKEEINKKDIIIFYIIQGGMIATGIFLRVIYLLLSFK